MGSVTIYPSVTTVGSTSGVPVNPSLTGAASFNAAMDASTSSYISYGGGNIGVQPRLICQFNGIRAAIPTNARITGLAFTTIQAFTAGGDRYWQPFRVWTGTNASDIYFYYGLAPLTKDGVFRTYTMATTAGGPSLFWEDKLPSGSDQVFLDLSLYGAFDSTTGNQSLASVALIVYYNEIPTTSGLNPTDLSAGNTFTSQPTYTWSYADPDADSQTSFQLILVPSTAIDGVGVAAGGTNFNPATSSSILYNSGAVNSGAATHTITGIIPNGTTMYAYVQARQSDIVGHAVTSAWTKSSVHTVSINPPPQLTGVATVQNTFGRIRTLWTDDYNSAIDIYNQFINIERSIDAGVTWSVVKADDISPWGLLFDASTSQYASGANNAANQITGNIDIYAFNVRPTTLTGASRTIISKWIGASAKAYWFGLDTAGKLQFRWSQNGTTINTALSTVTIGSLGLDFPSDKIHFYCDANVSTTSYSITFYYALDDAGTQWVQLGTPVTGTSAAANIFSSTSAVTIGAADTAETEPFLGYIGGIVVNSSTTPKYSKDFTTVAPIYGTTQSIGNDSAGVAWTANNTSPSTAYVFYDNLIPHNVSVQYRATGWGYASGGGSPAYGTVSATVSGTMTLTSWVLKSLNDTSIMVAIDLDPGSLDFELPKEKAIYKPLGSQFYVGISDGTRGYQGPLKVEVTTRAARDALRALYDADDTVILQGPYMEWTTGRLFFIGGWTQKMTDVVGQFWAIDLEVTEVAA